VLASCSTIDRADTAELTTRFKVLHREGSEIPATDLGALLFGRAANAIGSKNREIRKVLGSFFRKRFVEKSARSGP
jgi:hypothetical protein